MADIVISGDVSGAVTLTAPAVAGTTTLTLPATSGTLVVTGGAQTVQFAAGSAASPSITFTGDTNTGIYSPAADTIAFTEGGVESMRIDSSGNVGIGTSSFVGSERVNITFNSSGATTQALNTRDSNASANGNYHIVLRRSDDTYLGGLRRVGTDNAMGVDGNAYLSLQTTGTERMRIDSSGNVAIGTTSASGRLTVASTGTAIDCPLTNGSITLREAGGSSANNTVELHVRPAAGRSGYLSFTENAVADRWSIGIQNGVDALRFMNGSPTGGTERMRINSAGDLLVNTTTTNAAFKGFRMYSEAQGSYSAMGATGTGSYDFFSFYRGTDGSMPRIGFISTTGSGTSYSTTSDYRLKENIVPMAGALAKVSQLKPVTYTWKTDGSAGQGFIAHELQAVVPDCVTGEKDAVDAEGKPVYQGVDTSFLVATLTAAIQELNAKVEAQAAEIAALKGAN